MIKFDKEFYLKFSVDIEHWTMTDSKKIKKKNYHHGLSSFQCVADKCRRIKIDLHISFVVNS